MTNEEKDLYSKPNKDEILKIVLLSGLMTTRYQALAFSAQLYFILNTRQPTEAEMQQAKAQLKAIKENILELLEVPEIKEL
jgi:predicted HAD superfamily phosphohydrolase YqeG